MPERPLGSTGSKCLPLLSTDRRSRRVALRAIRRLALFPQRFFLPGQPRCRGGCAQKDSESFLAATGPVRATSPIRASSARHCALGVRTLSNGIRHAASSPHPLRPVREVSAACYGLRQRGTSSGNGGVGAVVRNETEPNNAARIRTRTKTDARGLAVSHAPAFIAIPPRNRPRCSGGVRPSR